MKRRRNNTFTCLSRLTIAALCTICFVCSLQQSFASDLIVNGADNHKQADSTQFNISGRVVDETGQPLPGATVFISNSKWAVGTDADGVFKISGVPRGNYEMLVRMIGYITFTKNFSIANRSITINATLKGDAIALNEVKIKAKTDPNRARYLKIFTDAFVGQTDFGKKSKIINSDVLRFQYIKHANTLTARSTDFIKIENGALGYNVYYLLNSFSFGQQDQTFSYDGKIYFEELKGDEKKKKEWDQNRSLAYYGSMQHFFRALYGGTTEAEGFKIYKIADSELGRISNYSLTSSVRSGLNIGRTKIDQANLKPIRPDSLFKNIDLNKVLKLPLLVNGIDTTRFYICYTRKNEPSKFLNTGAHLNIPVPNAQISRLYQLNNRVILNKNGTLDPEKSVMIEGFWGWHRVGDVLPEELIPTSVSQKTLSEKTDSLVKSLPVEKIHIQMDRPWYLTSDTAWLKVYVVDAYNKPVIDSKICFVELINGNKRIVKNLRLPLSEGVAWGEIALSDSLVKSGAYILRAYTNNTQKNGNPFFYKTIRLANVSSASAKLSRSIVAKNQPFIADSLKLRISPEGGALVNDVNSRIAVSVSALGKPVSKMAGYVINNEDNHVAKFETNDSGVSTFDLKPLRQSKYWAVLPLPNGGEKRFALPQAQSAGLNMAVKQNDEDIIVFFNSANLSGQTSVNLVIKADDKIQYQAEKLLLNAADSIVIGKTDVPAGILQFNLYANGDAIAERMVYNQNDRQLNVKLSPNKALYKPHDKVELNIDVNDADGRPVSGSFSISVNNEADIAGNDNNEKNILGDLLMRRTQKNGNPNLNYAAAKLNPNMQRELDDLLLTVNTQTNKKQALTQQVSVSLPQDTSTALRGRLTTDKGKPAASSVIGLFFSTGGPTLTAISDGNGRFVFNDIPVKRGELFYAVAKDKNKDLLVTIDKYEAPPITDEMMADTIATDDTNISFIAKRIEELTTGNILGTVLKEVTIKDKKVEPSLKEVLRGQSSNLDGRADRMFTFIDLLNAPNPNLLTFLASNLGGVFIFRPVEGRPWLIMSGRSVMDKIAIFVDGVEREDAINSMSLSDVASVEFLKGNNATAYGVRGANGVIVITTKRGGLDYAGYEMEHFVPGSTKTVPIKRYRFENGFDMPREFYAPNYNTTPTAVMDKWRPTIYWNPNITTGTDGKAQLSYFTNAAPGTYRVTIEGVDDYGRIARQVFKYTVSK